MKILEKLLGVVTVNRMQMALTTIVAELEQQRNRARRSSLEQIEKLNATKDGEKIQNILLQLNQELITSYEKETTLRTFINELK